MKKIFLVVGLCLFAGTVQAQHYEVIAIKEGRALVRDAEKNVDITVEPGTALSEEWTVVRVNKDAVIIEKRLSDEARVRGILPAPARKMKGR